MIREANFNDLTEIAQLHIQSFENHFLPKLGVKLLSQYYKEFMTEKNIFLVSVNDNNQIDGLVLGTQSSDEGRNRFIKNNIFRLFVRMCLLCLKFDKDAWSRILAFIRNRLYRVINNKKKSNSKRVSSSSFSLLSICVSQKVKGRGVSRSLIEEFENRLANLGYEYYTLTVQKSNMRAINFYNKLHMSIYRETDTEYGYI